MKMSRLVRTCGLATYLLSSLTTWTSAQSNVNSTASTEQKLIEAMINGNWKKNCPLLIPASSWTTSVDSSNEVYSIVPMPGSYFAQFNFNFSVLRSLGSQASFVYVNQLNWEDAHSQLGWDYKTYHWAQEIQKLVPSPLGVIPYEASALIYGESTDKLEQTLADLKSREKSTLKIRRKVSYEDGSQLENTVVKVYQGQDLLFASLEVLSAIDPYPTWQPDADDRPVNYGFSCQSSDKMKLTSFGKLCKAFLERHLLAPKVLDGSACATE